MLSGGVAETGPGLEVEGRVLLSGGVGRDALWCERVMLTGGVAETGPGLGWKGASCKGLSGPGDLQADSQDALQLPQILRRGVDQRSPYATDRQPTQPDPRLDQRDRVPRHSVP